MIIYLLLFSLLTAVTDAAEHHIIVGRGAYHPANIIAMPDDTITFQFWEGNHSVTQTTFDSPCGGGIVGFNSGFMPVGPETDSAYPNYTIKVNDTAPIWAYSAQTDPVTHCAFGMVFSVNAPERNDFDIFQAAAVSMSRLPANTWKSLGSRSSSPSSVKFQLFKRTLSGGAWAGIAGGVGAFIFIAGLLWYFTCQGSRSEESHRMELNRLGGPTGRLAAAGGRRGDVIHVSSGVQDPSGNPLAYGLPKNY